MTISSSPIKKLNFYAYWFRPQTTLNLLTLFLLSPVCKQRAESVEPDPCLVLDIGLYHYERHPTDKYLILHVKLILFM